MKLLKCNQAALTLEVIDLPRAHWHIVPPGRVTVALTLAAIIVTAVVWGLM